jgi:hypothetical protein
MCTDIKLRAESLSDSNNNNLQTPINNSLREKLLVLSIELV